jgi:hypothetical protein
MPPGARWSVSSFSPSAPDVGRSRLWGPTRPDAWLAGAVAVASVGTALAAPAAGPYRPVDALAVVLAVVGPLGLLWRQAVPLAALAASGLVVVVNAAAGFSIGFLQWTAYISLFTCFALGGRRLRIAAVAVAGLAGAGYLALDRGAVDAELLSGIATSYLIAAIAGHATRVCCLLRPPGLNWWTRAGSRRSPPSGCSPRNAAGWPASCTTRWGTRST